MTLMRQLYTACSMSCSVQLRHVLMCSKQCKSCAAGWIPPSLGYRALETALLQPAMPAAVVRQAPSPDEVADPKSAHQEAEDVLHPNALGAGQQRGLFGLQAYNSQSDSETPSPDHSTSQSDQKTIGVMGPFF